MPKHSKPRAGSLQFLPRKRAKRIYSNVNWQSIQSTDVKPLGFAAWKVGMTHVQLTDTNQKSLTYGKIISRPVTVLESPSLFVLGVKYYKKTTNGLQSIGEKWIENVPKELELERKTPVGKKKIELEKIKSHLHDIRLIVASQPKKSNMKKKRPDVFELGIGGQLDKKIEYSNTVLGKELNIKDIFKPGEYIDVSAVTKGYGVTGPVKRYGIKKQHRKNEQMHRHVGSIGPTTPRRLMWQVPAAGQYGFFNRTEYNKKILLIDDDTTKTNVKGGYLKYGNIKATSIMVEGSIPGVAKRLVMVRKASRARRKEIPVDLKYISTESKQGTR